MSTVKIFSYSHEKNVISLGVEYRNRSMIITISHHLFEIWLSKNERLDWIMSFTSDDDEFEEMSGMMTIDEYWAMDEDYVKEDLLQYLEDNPLEYKSIIYDDISKLIYVIDNAD